MNVPQNGVFVLESTLAKILNNSPSDDIAYKILGNGNSVPIILKNNNRTYSDVRNMDLRPSGT